MIGIVGKRSRFDDGTYFVSIRFGYVNNTFHVFNAESGCERINKGILQINLQTENLSFAGIFFSFTQHGFELPAVP